MRRWWTGSEKTASANGATYGLSDDQVWPGEPSPATRQASRQAVLRPCRLCSPLRNRMLAASDVASKSPAQIGGSSSPAASSARPASSATTASSRIASWCVQPCPVLDEQNQN